METRAMKRNRSEMESPPRLASASVTESPSAGSPPTKRRRSKRLAEQDSDNWNDSSLASMSASASEKESVKSKPKPTRKSARLSALEAIEEMSSTSALPSAKEPAKATRKSARLSALENIEEIASTSAPPSKTEPATRFEKKASVSKPRKSARLKKIDEMSLLKQIEAELYEEGFEYIVGVDEAGRGPLAGPVVVCACHVPLDWHCDKLNDSKQLTEAQRESAFDKLTNDSRVKYSVSILDREEIDKLNILQATLKGMGDCVNEMVEKQSAVDLALIDGNKSPECAVECRAIVKGDAKVYSIAAASVIAKVTRDRLMVEFDKQWPQYGFAQHKGYGSAAHRAAVWKYGPCDIHRRSFNPVKAYIAKHGAESDTEERPVSRRRARKSRSKTATQGTRRRASSVVRSAAEVGFGSILENGLRRSSRLRTKEDGLRRSSRLRTKQEQLAKAKGE